MTPELKDSVQCVQCGLCLPHCPTYRATRDEAESPRGRLMLMRSLAEERLQPTAAMASHFDRCLHCGSCTAMCPAKVPYARLIDAAKHRMRQSGNAREIPWWLKVLVASRVARRGVTACLTLADACGVLRKRVVSRMLRVIACGADPAMLPSFRAKHYRALSRRRVTMSKAKPRAKTSRIVLFTGCVADVFDRETLWASFNLLKALRAAGEPIGDIHVPREQVCCGSLHHHNGDAERAQQWIKRNAEAFADADTIVTCASGCGLFLREHMPQRVVEISAYVEEQLARAVTPPRFRPLSARVAVHTPCTLRTAFSPPMVTRLLQRIPNLEIKTLPYDGQCCGAGGINMLTQAKIAETLGEKIIRQTDGCDILLTGNIGCALHLRHMAKHKRDGATGLEVMHPITLLWRQLERAAPADTP